ncbi:MAG TPA: hypothetical protein VGV35_05515, partial [Bryobacteraceae bacterium]|nr:hypothetical protein [Bryobacteraceae bacterium]
MAIDTACRADALVSFENSFAQVSRVGAQAPFFYAPIGAEGLAAFRDFQVAPAAKVPAVGA